jgi:hypothetical protein
MYLSRDHFIIPLVIVISCRVEGSCYIPLMSFLMWILYPEVAAELLIEFVFLHWILGGGLSGLLDCFVHTGNQRIFFCWKEVICGRRLAGEELSFWACHCLSFEEWNFCYIPLGPAYIDYMDVTTMGSLFLVAYPSSRHS